MEKTRTDLTKWFIAIYLIAGAAHKLFEDIEVSYKTTWLMLHKIQQTIMRKRDVEYTIIGVELDDAFLGAHTEGGKRGRGTEKIKVLVGLSLNKQGHPRYVKMEVTPDITGETLVDVAEKWIVQGSTISSDAYRSYRALGDAGFHHEYQVHDAKETPVHLHWLHTVLSNTKAFVSGIFHGLDFKHLQSYLGDFVIVSTGERSKVHGQPFNDVVCLNEYPHSELVG